MPSNASLIASKALTTDSGISNKNANAAFKSNSGTQETLLYETAMLDSNPNQGYMTDFANFSTAHGTSLTGDIRYYRHTDTPAHSSMHPYNTMSSDDAVMLFSPTLGYDGEGMFAFVQGPTNSTGGGTGTGEVTTNSYQTQANFLLESSDAYMTRDPADGLDANDPGPYSPSGKQYRRTFTLSFWARCLSPAWMGTTESHLVSMFGQGTGNTNLYMAGEIDMWMFFPGSNGNWNANFNSTYAISNGEIYHNTSKGGVYLRVTPPSTEWTHYEFTVIADLDHSGVSHRLDLNTDYLYNSYFGFELYPAVAVSRVKLLARDISMAHEFDVQVNQLGAMPDAYKNNISLVDTYSNSFVSDLFD